MTESVEQKERRRRWLSLAEVVGVGGLLIAAAGLYLSWSDRHDKVVADAQTGRFELRGEATGGGDALALRSDERHAIEGATVQFPAALGVTPKEALASEIERDWFEKALLRATDGGPDDQTGTLPVLLTVRYEEDDTTKTARGLYDIVWRTQGQTFPRGRKLTLLSLRRHANGGTQAQLDARWATASARRSGR